MKEFEKKFPKPVLNTAAEDIDISLLVWKIKKDVWKAALEQVVKWGTKQYGNDFLFMDLYKDIRKELEEK